MLDGYLENSYPANGSIDPNATGSASVVTSGFTPDGGNTESTSTLQVYNPLTFGGLVAQTGLGLISGTLNAAGTNFLQGIGSNFAISGTAAVLPIDDLGMLALGGSVTLIGGTNQVFVGPSLTLALPGEGVGANVTVYSVPPGVDAGSVLGGAGASINIQPFPEVGVTVSGSPTASSAIAGYTFGTRTTGSLSAGYGICVVACTPRGAP
jgi:hypothetical protein